MTFDHFFRGGGGSADEKNAKLPSSLGNFACFCLELTIIEDFKQKIANLLKNQHAIKTCKTTQHAKSLHAAYFYMFLLRVNNL